jgi:hypothetical protein
MAQPTIYADIDCDGQVEVKVNNDTGYDCTIITSTGINETISSTATDVYRNYNLTSSDWVKVVAAQDATIAANKLTGTIKYITSVTTTPTPTTTTPTPTTTTTTTPAGGGALPTGGADCDNTINYPSFSTTYQITLATQGTEYWYYIAGLSGKTIRMSVVGDPTTGISGTVSLGHATDGSPPCFADVLYPSRTGANMLVGQTVSGSTSGKFFVKADDAPAVGTWDIWVS